MKLLHLSVLVVFFSINFNCTRHQVKSSQPLLLHGKSLHLGLWQEGTKHLHTIPIAETYLQKLMSRWYWYTSQECEGFWDWIFNLETQIVKVQVNSISFPSFHLQLRKLIDIKSLKIDLSDITIESYTCLWAIATEIHLIKISVCRHMPEGCRVL